MSQKMPNNVEIDYYFANKLFGSRNGNLRRFFFTYILVFDDNYKSITSFVKDYARVSGMKERMVWIIWKEVKRYVNRIKTKKPNYLKIRLSEVLDHVPIHTMKEIKDEINDDETD